MDDSKERVRQLACEAAGGSREAFGDLVRLYGATILSYCRGKARDSAEDLAQEVFVTAYRRFGSYDPSRPFGPWLFAVARNVAIDASRRRMPPAAEDGIDAVDNVSPAESVSASDAENAFWRIAGRALSARQLEVLELRASAGMSVADIAAATGLTCTAVKVVLFRARKALIAAGADRPLREGLAAVVPAVERGFL